MAPAGERTLVLLRHAKSDWPDGVPDLHRPLGPRGRRDAPVAGRWLRLNVGRPDEVRVSPATRTRQTWELVSSEWRDHEVSIPAVTWDERIYEAEVADLVEVVHGLDPAARVALIIGHNYGLEDLAGLPPADDVAGAQLAQKFPTSAIAVISVDGAWTDFPAAARLRHIEIPRG